MWGRPIRRSARQGPLFGSAGSLFSARSGRKTAPAPPAVCALSAAAARLLRPEQRAATARRAPDACQLSAAADLGRRKNVIFRLASSCCSGADMPPTPPGADMPPTTSSDAEGFRRRIIAFRKPSGSLLKARISAFRPALRFTDFNGHIACGHERGHGRSISRGNKRSGGGHSAQCRGSWLTSVLHVPVALWGSNRRSEAKAAKIICQLHPPPRPTCVRSPTVRR